MMLPGGGGMSPHLGVPPQGGPPHPHPHSTPPHLHGHHHPPPGGGLLPPPHPSPSSASALQSQISTDSSKDKSKSSGEDKEASSVSAMPLPPMHYVKEYTDENVARGLCPPPPPVITDNYSMFGKPFSADDTIIQSLESQGIRRLYPSGKDVDRKKELHKLNHSILVNFLDLIDILIKAPESAKRDEKIDDLNLLFIHMHHLINEFRPHQARETLRVMLHVQKRKRLQVAERFQANLDRVQETIEQALESLPEEDSGGKALVPTESVEMMEDSSNGGGTRKGSGKDPRAGECMEVDKTMCRMADEWQQVAEESKK